MMPRAIFSALILVWLLSGPAMAQNTTNFHQPYDADDNTVFLFHMDTNGDVNDNFEPNAAANLWGGWCDAVTGDPASNRWATVLPEDNSAFNKSVYFSGDNAKWPRISILVNDQGVLDTFCNFTTQLTLEAWIRPDRVTGLQRIISQGGCHFLYMTENQLEFWADFTDAADTSDSIVLTTTNANLQPNQWYHVAAMWDGAEASILVNGVKVASASFPGKGNLRRATTSDWLVLGAAPWENENFKGYIDEVRISKVARKDLVPVELSTFTAE